MATLKPTSPLHPKNAPKTPISHPQRRRRFQTSEQPGLQGLAAVPVGGGITQPKFRMQFPHDTNRCTLKNRRISTIRFQHLKYTQGNCMRNYCAGGAGLRCRWAAGPGCGARGRRQGLAGLRGDAPISDPAPLVWRAPEGPEGTGGLRGAAPNEVRMPSLAGGRGLRCPEHPWGHNTTSTNNVARPRPVSRPRPRHSVSAAQKDGTARNSASDQAVMST